MCLSGCRSLLACAKSHERTAVCPDEDLCRDVVRLFAVYIPMRDLHYVLWKCSDEDVVLGFFTPIQSHERNACSPALCRASSSSSTSKSCSEIQQAREWREARHICKVRSATWSQLVVCCQPHNFRSASPTCSPQLAVC
jgi:hypothetical protein